LTGSTRPEHFTIGITQDDANVCSKTFRINHMESIRAHLISFVTAYH